MILKKLFVTSVCIGTFSFCTISEAREIDLTEATLSPIYQTQTIFEVQQVNYGLIPNPFKIVKKTASKAIKKASTAPLRATKAKIKAAKKAAKIAKNTTNAVKEIGGDNEGKAPSGDYERTPYTKDRYYRSNTSKKGNISRSTRKNYDNYEFSLKEASIVSSEANTASKNSEAQVVLPVKNKDKQNSN